MLICEHRDPFLFSQQEEEEVGGVSLPQNSIYIVSKIHLSSCKYLGEHLREAWIVNFDLMEEFAISKTFIYSYVYEFT